MLAVLVFSFVCACVLAPLFSFPFRLFRVCYILFIYLIIIIIIIAFYYFFKKNIINKCYKMGVFFCFFLNFIAQRWRTFVN